MGGLKTFAATLCVHISFSYVSFIKYLCSQRLVPLIQLIINLIDCNNFCLSCYIKHWYLFFYIQKLILNDKCLNKMVEKFMNILNYLNSDSQCIFLKMRFGTLAWR